ncbi:MAG: methylenetetrahydrofolate reductase [NAD(P)H] [Fimbriimonadaceae bacterium]|jgi:methylenetetrahydrofolate reductase (NADPH)|nr:methylenetetrahydrofolate reductase [NAD(P)H] [Fimbriimonadaceae bacterium]
MRIIDKLEGPSPQFSFEYFPPKTEDGEKSLFQTVGRMKELGPAFASVTCGAGGSTRGKTVEWARKIKEELGVEAVVHLTCLGVDEDELRNTIQEIKAHKLINVLALRGDLPQDGSGNQSHCQYANELISLIREIYPEACIAAAAYPETHVDANNRFSDLENLKRKADAGADLFVTQLFFDNRHYFEFVGRARSMGITQPIIPGIMPIQNVGQTIRFIEMCGASIPDHLMKLLRQYEDSPKAVYYIGVAHAIAQCDELLRSGVPGIHFYTLNKSPATRLVVEALRGKA